MQRSELRLRIQDMLDAVAEIQTFTAGLSSEAFRDDALTMRAVEYNFVVLGEAARNVPADARTRYPLVPWLQMIGLRNVIVHQYRRADPDVLGDTVQNGFPTLVPLLREILEREP